MQAIAPSALLGTFKYREDPELNKENIASVDN